MIHTKNICINCEDDGRAVHPSKSLIIRFCAHTRYFMLPVIDKLSHAFCTAQMNHDEFSIKDPYEVSIIFPHDHPYKISDPETAMERIEWFIHNMRKPDGGIKFSIYQNTNMAVFRNSGWYSRYMWEMEDTWKPTESNYVSLQVFEPLKVSTWSTDKLKRCMDKVYSEAKLHGLDVKEVSYAMPYEEMYRTMLGARMHFSYSGASYFLAALARVPTIGMGQPSADYIQEVGMDNWYFKTNIFHHVGTHPNQHVISRNGVVCNGPVTTTMDTKQPRHIIKAFELALNNPEDFWDDWYKRFYEYQTPGHNDHMALKTIADQQKVNDMKRSSSNVTEEVGELRHQALSAIKTTNPK